MTSIEYLDVSKHMDTLGERYVEQNSVLKEGTHLDKMLHQYAQARQQAKGMGKQADYPNLVPVVLKYENEYHEGGVTTRNRAAPGMSGNGEALFVAQLGESIALGKNYAALLPANDLQNFENHNKWTVSYTPKEIAESFLNSNYLEPAVWTDEGNPILRESFFRVLNQSPELDEDEELVWKGEPSTNEYIQNGVSRDEYGNMLRKIAGVDLEEDRETVIARNAKDVIAALPRDEKFSIIEDFDVEMDTPPQFAQESDLTEAIYNQLGDVRDLDEWASYDSPEMVMEDEQ